MFSGIRPPRPGGTQSRDRGRIQSLVQSYQRSIPCFVLPSHRKDHLVRAQEELGALEREKVASTADTLGRAA